MKKFSSLRASAGMARHEQEHPDRRDEDDDQDAGTLGEPAEDPVAQPDLARPLEGLVEMGSGAGKGEAITSPDPASAGFGVVTAIPSETLSVIGSEPILTVVALLRQTTRRLHRRT